MPTDERSPEAPARGTAGGSGRPRAGSGPLRVLGAVVLVLLAALTLREVASLIVPVLFGLFLALVACLACSTGAPPPRKVAGLPGLLASFGRSERGVDFRAIDGKPTHLFFSLFAPENSAGAHLKALARISRIFKNPAFRDAILKAPGAEEIFRLIEAEDAKY